MAGRRASGMGLALVLALVSSLFVSIPKAAAGSRPGSIFAADSETDVRVVSGSTQGPEGFNSPDLPDDADALPAGSDEIDADRSWADIADVPVEVRSAGEVTVLPESAEDSATTVQLAGGPSDVDVEISVAPTGDGLTPGLVLEVDRLGAPAEPAPPLAPPSDQPDLPLMPGQRVATDPELEPTPTPTPTEGGSEPSGEVPDGGGEVAEEPVVGDAVELRVSYADFRYAFGGDWGSRLRVVAYPACWVTSPEHPECGQGVVVPSTNDVGTETLTFSTVDLNNPEFLVEDLADDDGVQDPQEPTETPSPSPSGTPEPSPSPTEGVAPRPAALVPTAGGSAGGTVYSVSASPAGEVGNFAAEPIKPSSAWQVGEGSGDFSYGYPVPLPAPAVGGSAPSLSLGYSSGSVDGMNMAENGQASMMGLGWDLSTAFITREYASCAKDGQSNVGDLCWKTDGDGDMITQYSIVLNGKSTKIVRDKGGNGVMRLQDDPGWTVTMINGDGSNGNLPNNSDPTDEAIKVMTPDGTTYWFGWGWGSNSVLTVPVFGNNPGEPCYHANGLNFAGSWCMQAWRWGLDKVIDRHGNVTLYDYEIVQNRYARTGNTSNAQLYDRDGYLTSIRYGRSQAGIQAYTRVLLDKRPRCVDALTSPTVTCEGSGDAQNDPAGWPDVPSDLICTSTTTCTNFSPSFFSTARYDSIRTQRINGAAIYDVDKFQLNFQLPSNANDNPGNQSLWLSSIQRIGLDGTNITLPKVTFDGEWLQNRVKVPTGGSKFLRLRINSLRNEAGGRVDVTYGHTPTRACDATYVTSLAIHASTRECYPRKLVNDNWEWWHKYVVNRVALGDDSLGYRLGQTGSLNYGRARVVDYEYLENPGWRHRPSPLTPAADETWDDWRGYERAVIHNRAVSETQVLVSPLTDISRKEITRFRGLAGSKKPSEPDGYRHDTVSTFHATYTDDSWLNGRTAQTSDHGSDGTETRRTAFVYGDFETADSDYGLNGHYVYQSAVYDVPRSGADERTTLWTVNSGGTDHRGKLLGAVEATQDNRTTVGVSSDDLFVCSDWVNSNSTALVALASTTTRTGSCSGSVKSHTDYVYDTSGSVGGAPTNGNPTYTTAFVDGATSATSKITTKSTWDAYGRPLIQRQPTHGDHTTAAVSSAPYTKFDYNPDGNSDNFLTHVRTTGPVPGTSGSGFVSNSYPDMARGLSKDSYDINGHLTRVERDALGRATSVWLPGRSVAGNASATFAYRDSASDSGRTWSRVLREGTNVYDDSYEFADGWGRPIQSSSQNQGANKPWIATATSYDDAGQAWLSVDSFAIANGAETAMPTLSTTPHYTVTDFDSLGRPTKASEKSNGAGLRATEYTYTTYVDGVALVPSGSSTPVSKTRTSYNKLFEVENVTQYGNGATPDVSPYAADDGYAEYTYTATGQLETIKTPRSPKNGSGDYPNLLTYTYGYDRLGRKSSADDPDTGTTDYTYDARGNTLSVNDQMPDTGPLGGPGGSIVTDYDNLNRPTARKQRLADGTTQPLAEWFYDASGAGSSIGRLTQSISHTPMGDFTNTVTDYSPRGNPLVTKATYPSSLTGESTNLCGTDPGVCTKVTTRSYNELGLPVTTIYPAVPGLPERTVTTNYGTHGTYLSLNTPMTSGTRKLGSTTYDELNRPTELLSIPSTDETKALKRLYAWSNDDRLTSLTGQAKGGAWFDQFKLSYEYDHAGNPRTITGKRRDIAAESSVYGAWCYTYDGINRLRTAKTAKGSSTGTTCAAPSTTPEIADVKELTGETYSLAYDYAQSRLKQVTSGANSTTYSYPTIDDQAHAPTVLTRPAAATGLPDPGGLTYDLVGRASTWTPTGGPTTTYAYEPQGGVSVADTTNGGPVNKIENAYDTDGIRVARRHTNGSNVSTTVYVAGAEIIKAPDGALTSTRTYTTPGGTPLAQQTGTSTTETWKWLLADGQDSIRGTRDPDSALAAGVTVPTYYPYGDPTSTSAALPGERGYLNKSHDPDGTIRLDHRSYDPSINTLITPDPLMSPTDPQNLNPYAYSRNNPLTFRDPSGLRLALNGGGGVGNDWQEVMLNGQPGDVSSGFTPTPTEAGNGAEVSSGSGGVVGAIKSAGKAIADHRVGITVTLLTAAAVSGACIGTAGFGCPAAVAGGSSIVGYLAGGAAGENEVSPEGAAFAGGTGAIGGGLSSLLFNRIAAAVAARSVTRSAPGSVNKVGGTQNCTACAIAGDATLAGRPASALKLNPDLPYKDGMALIQNYASSTWRWTTGRAAIQKELMAAGNGARGIVYGLRPNGTAHVFNAVVQRGRVNFVDFQTGGAGTFGGFSRYAFIRTG